MVAYNFKPQFAPLIQSGQKRQTIRAKGQRRPPMSGESLQLYTGMRTRGCKKLIDPDPICKSVHPIVIDDEVTLDGKVLLRHEVLNLARSDGFDDIPAFVRFFKEVHGLPFEGYLIKWS